MNYDSKIIDDYIKAIDYTIFQDFCDRLLLTLFPKEYTPVRAGGRNGDMKNDGYCTISRYFFQAHATRGESAKQTKFKIETDLKGCIQNWKNVNKFIYITNDTLIGEIELFVDNLRVEYPNLEINTWGHKKLVNLLRELPLSQIEYVIDRKIVFEQNKLNSDILSAKFLITKEFDAIKEISQNDLSRFPFENPLLFENSVLKFIRTLTKGQLYRHYSFENVLQINKDDYVTKYPDAITLPCNNGEYRFFYHERIPSHNEILKILKHDNVSKFLCNNNVAEERISKIKTCYEDECGGGDKFEEIFQLRPLYVQFLIIKNISNFPIKLDTIESCASDGVLYSEFNESEINNIVQLPEISIEPNQNLIFPIGLFLTEFENIEELEKLTVSSVYVPEQAQELHYGNLESDKKIEFIGPSLIPKIVTASLDNKKNKSNIHPFSFEKLYWINRYWMCGSCPHLFYSTGENLKYQGEIFNNKPNHNVLEEFTVPYGVNNIIIAELEYETTIIKYIKVNGYKISSTITLNKDESYKFSVSSGDKIEIFGRYIVVGNSDKILPITLKNELITKFKKNYA